MESRVTVKTIDPRAIARLVLESAGDDRIILSVPGTDYRLHLAPAVPAKPIATPPGKRLKGAIHARALRIHPAKGGGRFIEPIDGMPRIVAGAVLSVDAEARQAIVDVGVPMVVSMREDQDLSVLVEGELVNFYVESGATFAPIDSR